MRRQLVTMAVFAGLIAAPAAAQKPATLEDCYLRVALEKTNADVVYLAREICDAVFKPAPRAIAVLDGKTSRCEEWWFDERGRYESADQYCSLEPRGDQTFAFACQWKGANRSRYTYVVLRETAQRFEPVGELRGHDVGALFPGLAACVEQRAGGAAGGP